MSTDLAELVQVSRHYGANPRFCIAGGGNTSLKGTGTMWVKASGHALAEIDANEFVPMDVAALNQLVESDLGHDILLREERFKQGIYAARLGSDLRPSVECAVHALFPHRLVVHTHSTYVNMVSCAQGGETLAREIWGDEIVWVPYVDPGYVLAKAVREAISGRSADRPLAVVLQNHGLFVAAESFKEIDAVTENLVEAVRNRISIPDFESSGAPGLYGQEASDVVWKLAPTVRGHLMAKGHQVVVGCRDSDWSRSFAADRGSAALTELGPLIPDQIVYCRSFPLWVSPESTGAEVCEAIDRYLEQRGAIPTILLVPGIGQLTVSTDLHGAGCASDVYDDAIQVMLGAQQLGGVHSLDRRESEFIEEWEVEQYRRSVSLQAARGRIAGKVVVITGGAQGFGAGIADGLLSEGAQVVLIDRNRELVSRTAELLCARYGWLRAVGFDADVTNAEAIERVLDCVAFMYGGVDVVISNAGVLRAGSVKEQSPEEFRTVTEVNYVGFFLICQAFSKLMSIQNLASPGRWSDIVQINSKSGLEGSNRNGAYAGSKFGSIGLVQSFAKELVEDRIKVNAVCPGNFFDGPLWSDPENGLFAQYLRTGKVPGAKTIGDVKRAYESKVPMGRGCRVEDVVRAILYLVEQEYETGQALPVTGGQVMLH